MQEEAMATYYTRGSSSERENLQGSYQETQFLPGNAMIYMNPTGSYSAIASGSVGEATELHVSSSQQDRQVLSCFNGGGGSSLVQELQEYGSWRDQSNDSSLIHHPMTAGSPAVLQTGQGLSLSLGSQMLPGIHQMNNNQSIPFRHNHNLSEPHGFSGGNQYQSAARTIPNSKYLKAAQQLLDEVVNVRKALKQFHHKSDKNEEGSAEHHTGNSNSQNPQESGKNLSVEISHAERQELQSKLTKLLSMLDEVDRRYKQYYHQMQIVMSSFDVIAGSGSAKPYTTLALQTISRHFRALRDVISGQIVITRKTLGETEGLDGKGVGISRLRYVDHQLRQPRTMHQQMGLIHSQAWRPQRGLPENSVMILRAWLFEHFLHPYPKDSDKIMLARQTGLSRSQVSNWFINARVRLWKPMVEEMYKEEFADAIENNDSNSSSETTPKTAATALDDETTPSIDQALESTPDNFLETGYGHGSSVGRCTMFHNAMIHGEQMGNSSINSNGRGGTGGVSLTLGLQNSGGMMMSQGFSGIRGDGIYENTPPAAGFQYVNHGNC